ncbi:Hypothetical predicted protein [Paramuricea clavata]|uniref:DUF6570 domain-containing protein n=1 Tax=Paramuricea clavata TaxID=317549 RepID=A0A6S7IUX5_PARCT|nr:Hypothetical predicted protein [Paramuricea clavata]
MQNETEEERTNRLQKRKQDQATETIDERARILEILRALCHTASSNESDQKSHEQLSMSVDPTVDISVPEADEDNESIHEAEGPGHGAEHTHRDFTVRRHKVLEAVLWLKTNNPFFKDIEIDRDVIQSLPENGIPDELRYVIDKNELSVHVENEGLPQDPVMSANASVEELVLGSGSTSFIPMRQRQRKEGAAIQDAVSEVDPLDWPSTEGNLINEFKTDGLASMA